jgi:cell division protein FtsQ
MRRDLHYWRTDGNRRVRLRRRRLTLARGVGAALLLALLAVGMTVGGRFLLRCAVEDPGCGLREVLVVGTELRDPSEIRSRVAPFLGHPLLELNLDRIRRAVEKDPWVSRAEITRVWPCSVRVEVRERVPVVLAMIEGEPWLASRDGTLLDPYLPGGPIPELPTLTGLPPGEGARRTALRRGALALEALAGEAPELAPRALSLDLSDSHRIELRLEGTDWPLWLDPGEPGRNLRAYAALRDVLGKDVLPAGVDLRWRGRIAVRPRLVEM